VKDFAVVLLRNLQTWIRRILASLGAAKRPVDRVETHIVEFQQLLTTS
jgi:hypothetical protein